MNQTYFEVDIEISRLSQPHYNGNIYVVLIISHIYLSTSFIIPSRSVATLCPIS